MSTRGLGVGLVMMGALSGAAACRFDPDLSRFEACAEDGTCAPGYTCLEERRLCLPDCGAQGPCTPEPPDAATDGGATDGGPGDGGTTDAGTDGGGDAGEPLSLVTLGLPPATETRAYAETLQARGGKPPYTFRPTEPLPQGFMLDGGVLSGTPTTAGTYRVAVEVRDESSPAASASTAYDLRVRPLLRVAGPELLVNGYVNNPYAEQVHVTGGTPPYLFAFETGSQAPPGLMLETTDGGVKGTPLSTGTYGLRLRVTDSDPQPQAASRRLDLDVTTAPLFLSWATQSVPDGRVGTPYHYVLKVVGASSPTWKLEAGTTPVGIGFDAAKATLVGLPSQPGVSSFTLSATSGLEKVERTFTLTVY